MARKHYYKAGRNLVVCDRCGGVYPSNSIKKEWTGALVCDGAGTRDCYEARHPMDYFRTKGELISVQEARPTKRTTPAIFIQLENGFFILQEEDGFSYLKLEESSDA
jgi:hypothetical protein